MNEQHGPGSERDRPILSAGEFLDWHEQLADEFDLKAKDLQMRLEADPSLRDDPGFTQEVAVLRAQIELLNKVGDDFSEHSIISGIERWIKAQQDE